MKLAMLTVIVVLFIGSQFGRAEIRLVEVTEGTTIVDSSVDTFVMEKLRRPVVIHHNHAHPLGLPPRVNIVKPSFPIPKGKFGIALKDGTRMIGVPQATSVTLQTTFGNATIPRDQIAKIETVNGVTRVHLANGDRVSGRWVTTVMQFDTQFGRLKVPVASLVWLRTSSADVTTQPIPTTTNANRVTGPRPPSGPPTIEGGSDASSDASEGTESAPAPR